MTFTSRTRASMQAALTVALQPRVAVAAVGSVISLGVAGAYLGGEAVQAATVRAKVERLHSAESEGYSEGALALAAGGLDSSALAIAKRHDPYGTSNSAIRDRQAEQLMARLDAVSKPLTHVPARPFQMTNALGQSRDLDCLTRAAYYEARGEGADGMRAVTQVVLNRVRHPSFPSSICSVVYQGSNRSTGCQFSFTCNGAMRGAVNQTAWNRARDIASKALSGQVYAAVGNATHFHTTRVAPSWRNSLVKVTQVGDHLFYRYGGRAGRADSFRDTPLPSKGENARVITANLPAASNGPIAYKAAVAADADPRGAVTTPALTGASPAALASTSLAPAQASTAATAGKPAAPSVPLEIVAS